MRREKFWVFFPLLLLFAHLRAHAQSAMNTTTQDNIYMKCTCPYRITNKTGFVIRFSERLSVKHLK